MTPLLIIPLIKINWFRLKCADGFLLKIKQVYTDLILTPTIPAWGIPAPDDNAQHTSFR